MFLIPTVCFVRWLGAHWICFLVLHRTCVLTYWMWESSPKSPSTMQIDFPIVTPPGNSVGESISAHIIFFFKFQDKYDPDGRLWTAAPFRSCSFTRACRCVAFLLCVCLGENVLTFFYSIFDKGNTLWPLSWWESDYIYSFLAFFSFFLIATRSTSEEWYSQSSSPLLRERIVVQRRIVKSSLSGLLLSGLRAYYQLIGNKLRLVPFNKMNLGNPLASAEWF